MIGKEIIICPKNMARFCSRHHKKQEFIEVLDTNDMMQIMQRNKKTRKVFFLAAISDVVGQVVVDVEALVVAEQNKEIDIDQI